MPIELSGNDFGEYYYSHDCGIPYERTEHWLTFFDNIADRIVKELEPKSVLDAGCAWGFLVEALRNRGVEAWGIDISEYAISNVHESIKDYCRVGSIVEPFDRRYDLIVNIEVLEHMQKAEAIKAIENFCLSSDRVLFSSTPFDYKEATHINVQVPEYWSREFSKFSFYRDLNFDASFITPWSSLFVKRKKTIPDLIYEYENKFWTLNKENIDLRQHVMEQVSKMEEIERLEVHFMETTKKLQEATESQQRDIERLNEYIRTIETANFVLLEERQKLQEATESQQREIDRLNEQIKTFEAANEKLGFLYNQWDALQSSRTWKLLQRLGRFKTFPDLSRQAVEKLFSQFDPSNTKTTPVDNDSLLKKNLVDTTSFFKEIKIGKWVFKPIAGIHTLSEYGEFLSTSDDPQLLIRTLRGKFLSGLVEIRCLLDGEQEKYILRFYYDIGNGFNERDAFSIQAITNKVSRAKVELPAGIRAMRLDPGDKPGKITIKTFELKNITTLKVFRDLWIDNKYKVNSIQSFFKMTAKAFGVIRNGGVRALEDRVYPNINASYQQWIINNEPSDRQLEEQRNISRALTYRPLLSLIMPVYNTPLDILEAAIRSVIAQTYNHWELCIANGSADSKDIMEVLSSFEKNEPRIKVIHLEKNLGIAENTNAAIKLASGEFIGFLDHDDLLAPFALFELAKALLDHPNIDMFYSDEDKISADGQERYGPFFKPAFSPDYLRSINYMPHFLVIKKSLGDEIGWLNNGFDGAQDYDLVLRAAEKAMYIAHCPCILYHWRAWGGSTALSTSIKDYATRSGIHAIQDHLERMRTRGVVNEEKIPTTYRVIYNLNSYPLVSIIIPNKDHADLLQRCVYSILQNTSYRNIEIIIVENNSQEEITFSLYAELKQLANVRVIQNNTQPFNFSNINNYAAEFAKGKILLFMNNDLEVINSDWIERMLEYIQRPDIGIVGAKLYYPDNTLQHGGVIIGIGGSAGHIHKHASRSSIGYFGRLVFPQNLSAVTGACLMIKKSIFEDVGGFDPSYQLAFGDIDLCLKVRSKGYLIVWTPYAELYHHESKTRGYEDTPEKQSRFEIEKVNLVKHWKNFLNEGDPYYNPNLSLDDEDFLIEPYARSQHIRIMKGF